MMIREQGVTEGSGGLPSEKRRMRKMERGKRRKARMMCTHR